MTEKETAQVLAIVKGAYPKFYAGMGREELLSIISVWHDFFAPYEPAVVVAAVKALIATDSSGFPPVIGQVMAKIRKLTEPEGMTEQEAWALVKKAISRSGYNSREEFEKLPKEIQTVLHDPGVLKEWAIDEDFNEGVTASNFMRSYRARAASIREWNAMPEDVKRIARAAGGGLALEEAEELRLEAIG